MIMKIKSLALLLIAITLLLNINIADAKNHKPKTKAKVEGKSTKPKIEKQDFCYIRGYFDEITEGETKYYICRLVSTAKCMAVPCNVWGPYGPNNKAVESAPVPDNLQIDQSKKYIVKFNVNGATEVQYVNGISIQETSDVIAVHYY